MVLRLPAALAAASLAASLALTAPSMTAGPGRVSGAAPALPRPVALTPGATTAVAAALVPGAAAAAAIVPGASAAAAVVPHAPPIAAVATPAAAAAASARVTEIRIDKSEHTLDLVADGTIVRSYRVALGPGGSGPKLYEGDRRTPVGTYRVAGRIKGLFHQFLVVSYPNEEDRRRFAELRRRGEVPPGRGVGHGIGIHGVGGGGGAVHAGSHKDTDWTLGCIALDDDEIDEVARRTPDGAKIVITD
ncbi:L,D-transpeptidase family protein [Sorangium sp. So ce1153]|uniref:L,D-transpeptidase family protein n=1 Tax=Sorangium sp. So ce1153 TaxID=3133333 RepID=UPI003F608FED